MTLYFQNKSFKIPLAYDKIPNPEEWQSGLMHQS